MARHGFGRGEDRHSKTPPRSVAGLRTALYPRLATLANRWNDRLGLEQRYPDQHAAFQAQCHEAG